MPRIVKPTSTSTPTTDMSVSWEIVSDTFSRSNVIMRAYGDTGTGRSSLAFSAPGPIAVFDCSEKQDGIIEPYAAVKKMKRMNFFVSSIDRHPSQVAAANHAMLQRVKAQFVDAYTWAKSIVIDTDTELWEIDQLATLGSFSYDDKTDQAKKMGQLAYTKINNEWRSLIKSARAQQSTNLILIAQTKPQYVKNNATGKTVVAGQKETSFMSDVVVRTGRKRDGTFTCTIEKGWMNAAIEGTALEDPPDAKIEDRTITFSNIMSLITDTDVDLWS